MHRSKHRLNRMLFIRTKSCFRMLAVILVSDCCVCGHIIITLAKQSTNECTDEHSTWLMVGSPSFQMKMTKPHTPNVVSPDAAPESPAGIAHLFASRAGTNHVA